MMRDRIKKALDDFKRRYAEKKNLVRIKGYSKAVFAGDIHGDLDAAKKVVERYLDDDTAVIFLGDYVDRGEKSLETVEFLFSKAAENDNIVLLMGNHEAFPIIPFYPNDFWQKAKEMKIDKELKDAFSYLPLAVSIGDIIALHGGLPDISSISEIDQIEKKGSDERFFSILWDYMIDDKGLMLWENENSGSRVYGEDYFNAVMERIGKKVLIRGHDYEVKGKIFGGRCITLMTSEIYSSKGKSKGRIVAKVFLSDKKEIVKNVKIEKV